jgi:hypothetical protein
LYRAASLALRWGLQLLPLTVFSLGAQLFIVNALVFNGWMVVGAVCFGCWFLVGWLCLVTWMLIGGVPYVLSTVVLMSLVGVPLSAMALTFVGIAGLALGIYERWSNWF